MNIVDKNNLNIKKGDILAGFLVKEISAIEDINSILYELEHEKTGAKYVHVSNDDVENTFSIAFRTPPSDSTGSSHIIEHTVLCGSKKFPVRDPFFSMHKKSLCSFMNAFTASDWTMYPFSTPNKKDFYNMIDVYLDAVFFPNLDELSFQQEGIRIELEENHENQNDYSLVYKGIVYNEMMGSMSSPSRVMYQSILSELYPSTAYAYNSGGDPEVIPDLTYKKFKEFYKRYYHPSNSFCYTYGNLPLEKHLCFLNDKVLSNFDKIDPKTDVAFQPRWEKPKVIKKPYPFDKNQDASKKHQVCISWLMSDISNSVDILSLNLLEEIMLGNSGSPVRKALISSNIGSDLSDAAGFHSDYKDTFFSLGLKDVNETNASEIEKIIFTCLNELVQKGIDEKLIDTAIHQLEFQKKEITNVPYPYGLKLFLEFCGSWIHGVDPVKSLKFDDDLKKIKDELQKGPFLSKQIEKYFLNNSHRILLILYPNIEMTQAQELRIKERLNFVKTNLTDYDIEKIKKDTEMLELKQNEIEDLSSLPSLEISEILKNVEHKEPFTIINQYSTSLYKEHTSGIFYFSSALGTGNITKDLVPFVPFLCSTFSRMGTKKIDYSDLAIMIARYTGGIGMHSIAKSYYGSSETYIPYISFFGKCLNRNIEKMFEILQGLIFDLSFSNMARLKNLLLEYKSRLESTIVHSGHSFVMKLAARNFSSKHSLDEIWQGVHQYQFIKNFTDTLSDEKLISIANNLENIAKNLFAKNNLKMAMIGEDNALINCENYIASIINGMTGEGKDGFRVNQNQITSPMPYEGWSTSSSVSFIGYCFETVPMWHDDSPALSVLSKIIKSSYIHKEIREKGGAYGGFSVYDDEDGLFYLASYRDPNISRTLSVFENVGSFIRTKDIDDEAIQECILELCAKIDKPKTPADAAKKSFFRNLVKITYEDRKKFKENLLSVNKNKLKEVIEKYFMQKPEKVGIAVISSEDKLNQANKELETPLKIYKI
ncbi:MAG: insulinase family protein [Desulfobacterales bacterium]|nr:insulinase family protein [Desulfobacterales bacterium]